MHHAFRLPLCSLLACLTQSGLLACGSGSEGSNPAQSSTKATPGSSAPAAPTASGSKPKKAVIAELPALVPEQLTFDVEWNKDAQIVAEADGKAHLLGEAPSESTLNYSFDLDAAAVLKLQPGDIAVLAGIAYRRVVSVTKTKTAIELVTERTTLPEAINSGTIDWAHAIDFSDATTLKSLQLSYGTRPLKRLTQLDLSGPISYEGDLEGDYHVSVTLTPGSGLGLSVALTKEILGENRFSLNATGSIQGFQTEGHLELDSGQGVVFQQGNRNIEGDLHLQAAAFNTGVSQELLNLPIGVDIPLQVGPVPLLLKLKVAVNVTLELNVADSSAQATVDLHFQSDTGISVTGSSLTPDAHLNGHEVTGFAGGSADAVAAGMTVCVEAPRLELSMLGEFASVGLTQNNCASTVFTFTPACNTVRGSITGLGLASLGFFGFSLASSQVELYKYEDDLTIGGAVCESDE